MKNITVALICLIALATFSGCTGNSSSNTVEKSVNASATAEKPSHKYTVIVTYGTSNGGEMADKYQTDVFMTTDSGIRFTTTEGKMIYTSNYVVYEN